MPSARAKADYDSESSSSDEERDRRRRRRRRKHERERRLKHRSRYRRRRREDYSIDEDSDSESGSLDDESSFLSSSSYSSRHRSTRSKRSQRSSKMKYRSTRGSKHPHRNPSNKKRNQRRTRKNSSEDSSLLSDSDGNRRTRTRRTHKTRHGRSLSPSGSSYESFTIDENSVRTDGARSTPGNKKGDAVKSGSKVFSPNQSSLIPGPENDDENNKREQTVTFNLNDHNHIHNDGSMHHNDNGSSHQGCVLAESSSTSTLEKRDDVEAVEKSSKPPRSEKGRSCKGPPPSKQMKSLLYDLFRESTSKHQSLPPQSTVSLLLANDSKDESLVTTKSKKKIGLKTLFGGGSKKSSVKASSFDSKPEVEALYVDTDIKSPLGFKPLSPRNIPTPPYQQVTTEQQESNTTTSGSSSGIFSEGGCVVPSVGALDVITSNQRRYDGTKCTTDADWVEQESAKSMCDVFSAFSIFGEKEMPKDAAAASDSMQNRTEQSTADMDVHDKKSGKKNKQPSPKKRYLFNIFGINNEEKGNGASLSKHSERSINCKETVESGGTHNENAQPGPKPMQEIPLTKENPNNDYADQRSTVLKSPVARKSAKFS